jgi:hypothetical protein
MVALREQFQIGTAIRLVQLGQEHPEQFEPWFAMQLAAHAPQILQNLEKGLAEPMDAAAVMAVLPGAYKMYGVPDAEQRVDRHRREAVALLMRAHLFQMAMPLIEQDKNAPPSLKAICLEGMGRHLEAAEIFRAGGDLKDALRNYRSIPDFEKSLALLKEIGGEQAAAESLEWITKLQKVLEKRPANLARTATAAEKKFLITLFEAQLDGPRAKKPAKPRAPRKTAAKSVPKRK